MINVKIALIVKIEIWIDSVNVMMDIFSIMNRGIVPSVIINANHVLIVPLIALNVLMRPEIL